MTRKDYQHYAGLPTLATRPDRAEIKVLDDDCEILIHPDDGRLEHRWLESDGEGKWHWKIRDYPRPT